MNRTKEREFYSNFISPMCLFRDCIEYLILKYDLPNLGTYGKMKLYESPTETKQQHFERMEQYIIKRKNEYLQKWNDEEINLLLDEILTNANELKTEDSKQGYICELYKQLEVARVQQVIKAITENRNICPKEGFENVSEKQIEMFIVGLDIHLYVYFSKLENELQKHGFGQYLPTATQAEPPREPAQDTPQEIPPHTATEQAQELPEELNTPNIKRYFSNAIKAGYITDKYEWLGTKTELSLFCHKISEVEKLGDKVFFDSMESKQKTATNWLIFEQFINIKGVAVKNLSQSYSKFYSNISLKKRRTEDKIFSLISKKKD